jgi:hypothetical protein
MFSGLGKFARPAKGAAIGALTGWLTKQRFFSSIPAVAGSRLVTLALAGAFLSDQKGMVGEVAGEVGILSAGIAGFQFGRGETVSGTGAPSPEYAMRLAELEERVSGELDDLVGDEDDEDDDVEGDEVDEVEGDEVEDVIDVPVPA